MHLVRYCLAQWPSARLSGRLDHPALAQLQRQFEELERRNESLINSPIPALRQSSRLLTGLLVLLRGLLCGAGPRVKKSLLQKIAEECDQTVSRMLRESEAILLDLGRSSPV